MSLTRYLVPGAVAGIVSYGFSRVMIEPLIGVAVDYEAAHEHEHGHELFTRAVQENVGAAIGVVVFGVAMGALFGVAYTVLRTVLERRGVMADPTGLSLLLAAGMFAAIVLVPSLKFPANPPTVGLEDTIGERSSTFLAITGVSVVAACAAVAAGLVWSRRWGTWRAVGVAVGGYAAVMLCTMALLPSFHEVPADFPAEVLAEFRIYSLLNLALMWAVIGVTSACLDSSRRTREAEICRTPVPF
jgi:putative cobalt transporter subunit CbtA